MPKIGTPQLFFILILLFTACESSSRLKIAVAANLLYPMKEIKTAYEDATGKSFDLISGSSGVLSAQIINGAPFDLFLSANIKYPQALYQADLCKEAPRIIIRGRSVFWSKFPIHEEKIKLQLGSGQVKRLAIANPELAPYGAQAKNWLKKEKLWPKWKNQLIVGENIGQVNQYILTGNVDAAFTAISAKYARQLEDSGYWYMLDSPHEAGIPHSLVRLRHASDTAPELIKFLQSDQAQAIFQKYGYLSP